MGHSALKDQRGKSLLFPQILQGNLINQYPFLIKETETALGNSGNEGYFLSMIKNKEQLMSYLTLRSVSNTRQVCPQKNGSGVLYKKWYRDV